MMIGTIDSATTIGTVALSVGNLQRSIDFYTKVLGMKLLRTTDRPEQKYSLAFVGYDDEKRTAVLELTYNYGVERYELGSAFGHVAIGVADVKQACDKVRRNGGKEIVFANIEDAKIGCSAWGDDAHDLAAHEFFAGARLFHLVANGDLEAGANQSGEIAFCGVIGNAAHGNGIISFLISCGQGDFEFA